MADDPEIGELLRSRLGGFAIRLARTYRLALATALRGGTDATSQEVTLSKALQGLSFLFASANDGWSVDARHPGYILQKSPDGAVAVPFHLLSDFPSADRLSELVSLSERLRVGSSSTVCLSGSTIFAGSLGFVGDLDFCEYVDGIQLLDFLKLVVIGTEQINQTICWEFKYPGGEAARPWSSPSFPNALTLLQLVRTCQPARRKVKMDYVAETRGFGTTQATNLIIWVDPDDQESAAIEASFAFQEAPLFLGEVKWIPRSLAQPVMAATYIDFLCSEIDLYMDEEKPVKAAKRAISLAVFMLFDEHAERLRSFLKSNGCLQRDALGQRRRLHKQVSEHADPDVRAFTEPLAATCVALSEGLAAESPADLMLELSSIISGLRADVDTLRIYG